MKILYGITKSNFGGAQRYVFDLAKEARSRGHEVAVASGDAGRLTHELEKENIRVISLENLQRDISINKDIKSFFSILEILRREKPDVFHINSSKMGALGAFAARLAGIKRIIFTAHGWAFNEPRPAWQRFLIKLIAWITVILAHKTICVSQTTKTQISNWPFIKNRLSIIYNGLSKFNLNLNKRTDNTFTVGTIAELHKIKGLDILLTAWNKFRKLHDGKLVIIGSGEERAFLEKQARDLGIESSVEFKGFIENAREQLSQFDIFVLPSRSEAFPYALLEAGLAGLPVIATSVGGIPEIIEGGMTGALIPPEDPEALFSSLLLFYENPRMRDRLGAALKESVENKFSLETMLNHTFQAYL